MQGQGRRSYPFCRKTDKCQPPKSGYDYIFCVPDAPTEFPQVVSVPWGVGTGFMNAFYDANELYDAGTKAMAGSKFKYATQLYRMHHLLYTAMLQKDLQNGTYSPSPGKKFVIKERGKTRFITSNSTVDKTVNHVMSDKILMPCLQPHLIYDNSSSQKGKGVTFHVERVKYHLRQYFMAHGSNDGWIMLTDFSGFYANIIHSVCMSVLTQFLKRGLTDPEEFELSLHLLSQMFETFRLDVSRFSDVEIRRMYEQKVDPMMNVSVDPKLLTGEKFLEKGVELGNQNSQSIGLIMPYRIDNYAKIVCGIKGYSRYTDDIMAISDNKACLARLLEGIEREAKEYGLIINKKKTRIVKLSGFFRILKDGYSLTETGRIIWKINPKAITRERQRLKAHKRLLEQGIMSSEEIENCYKGWIGANWKKMSRRQIYNMTDLFKKLFGRYPKWKKRHSRLRWLMTRKSADWDSTATTS